MLTPDVHEVPITRPETDHVPSLRNVQPWIVQARGFSSTLAHDIAQERARRWISSRPLYTR
jgi:hypothetical protein